jgi:hypothetical protein
MCLLHHHVRAARVCACAHCATLQQTQPLGLWTKQQATQLAPHTELRMRAHSHRSVGVVEGWHRTARQHTLQSQCTQHFFCPAAAGGAARPTRSQHARHRAATGGLSRCIRFLTHAHPQRTGLPTTVRKTACMHLSLCCHYEQYVWEGGKRQQESRETRRARRQALCEEGNPPPHPDASPDCGTPAEVTTSPRIREIRTHTSPKTRPRRVACKGCCRCRPPPSPPHTHTHTTHTPLDAGRSYSPIRPSMAEPAEAPFVLVRAAPNSGWRSSHPELYHDDWGVLVDLCVPRARACVCHSPFPLHPPGSRRAVEF